MNKKVVGNLSTKPTRVKKKGDVKRGKSAVGGSAAERGMDFQARVIAFTLTYMLSEQKLAWLNESLDDTPSHIYVETGGPGDDIAIRTTSGQILEVQVKLGLQSGKSLWEALAALVEGIHNNKITGGVLIVCPNCSNTVRNLLAEDIVRIGTGRNDGLRDIGNTFVKNSSLSVSDLSRVCSSLRIVTLAAIDEYKSDEINAQNKLQHLVNAPQKAWAVLCEYARKLIRIRGTATHSSVLTLFQCSGVELRITSIESGIQLRAALCRWLKGAYSHFNIPGLKKPVSLQACWIPLKAIVKKDVDNFPTDLATALDSYHGYTSRSRNNYDNEIYDAHTLGRYVKRGIIIGGPGIGKSMLLRRIALGFVTEGELVLLTRLTQVVTLFKKQGYRFEDAIVAAALSSSGLRYQSPNLHDAVILCDGLDECGSDQRLITDALHALAIAHPSTRILLTSRPVGYQPGLLVDWRHYEILPLEDNQVEKALERVINAIAFDSNDERTHAFEIAKEQLKSRHLKGVATRSPLLLTMLATLASKGIEPGSSRPSLYRQLFHLIETFPTTRVLDNPPTEPERSWFITLLGWILIKHGNESFEKSLERCVKAWGEETQESHMQCMNKVLACFQYWEHVGIIECIHTYDEKAVTFVHKTFGEYSAAMFINKQDSHLQREIIAMAICNHAWRETLSFVSHLGLATEILDVWNGLISNGDTSSLKRLDNVLDLVIEAGIPPDAISLETFIDCCWKVAASSSAMRYAAGEALCNVAAKNWGALSVTALSHVKESDDWLWLVAWGCIMASAEQKVSSADVTNLLRHFEERWPKRLKKSRTFFDHSYGHDTRKFIIIGAARRILGQRDDVGLTLLSSIIERGRGLSVISWMELKQIYANAGIEMPGENYEALSMPILDMAIWNSWHDGFLTTIAGENKVQIFTEIEPERMNELGAFLAATHYNKIPISELRYMGDPRIDFHLRHKIILQVAEAAGIPTEELQRQAENLKRQIKMTGRDGVGLFIKVPYVDAIANYERLKLGKDDFDCLKKLIMSDSEFYGLIAANMILSHWEEVAAFSTVESIIKEGEGGALYLVKQMINCLPDSTGQQQIMERLLTAQPESGGEFLFEVLKPPYSPEHEFVVFKALRDGNPRIAVAAAKLAAKMPRSIEFVKELRVFYESWKQKEEPYPLTNGTVPESPRDVLADILTGKDSEQDVNLILEMLNDSRRSLKKVGEKALEHILSESGELQMNLVDWVLEGICDGELLGRIIEKVPLTPKAVSELMVLMNNESAEIRFGAMALLQKRYMTQAEIQQLAKGFLLDNEADIREKATEIMTSLQN